MSDYDGRNGNGYQPLPGKKQSNPPPPKEGSRPPPPPAPPRRVCPRVSKWTSVAPDTEGIYWYLQSDGEVGFVELSKAGPFSDAPESLRASETSEPLYSIIESWGITCWCGPLEPPPPPAPPMRSDRDKGTIAELAKARAEIARLNELRMSDKRKIEAGHKTTAMLRKNIERLTALADERGKHMEALWKLICDELFEHLYEYGVPRSETPYTYQHDGFPELARPFNDDGSVK